MVEEAFGGERRIAATLTAATPLLLTGLAAAIAFRAGIFNVGAEGCFYLGGWPPRSSDTLRRLAVGGPDSSCALRFRRSLAASG